MYSHVLALVISYSRYLVFSYSRYLDSEITRIRGEITRIRDNEITSIREHENTRVQEHESMRITGLYSVTPKSGKHSVCGVYYSNRKGFPGKVLLPTMHGKICL